MGAAGAGIGASPIGGWGDATGHKPKADEDTDKKKKRKTDEVFAEDWWTHARPTLELHGYYRVRAELFHNFTFGRIDSPGEALWPSPLDRSYVGLGANQSAASGTPTYGPVLCTLHETGMGSNNDAKSGLYGCRNKSQASANMRFRLNPELHISDNLRVVTQIDMLDNLVLGSTPEGYAITPDAGGGYRTVARGGYNPMGAFDSTQVAPTAGVNGFQNSIAVKRAWAEYSTPLGQLRFGRMPSHWGLGMVQNSGDRYDDDYQTTVDRIMFVTGIKRLDLYVAAAWDFPNEGILSSNVLTPQAQAHDAAQLDDVNQWMLSVVRRTNPQLQNLALSQGKVVVNGGAQLTLRKQVLAADRSGSASQGGNVPGGFPVPLADLSTTGSTQSAYVHRGLVMWSPNLWLQVLYKTFRFELEAATNQGKLDTISNTAGTQSADFANWKIRTYGIATETEYRTMENKLRLQFKFGYASGDPEASSKNQVAGGGLVPGYSTAADAQGMQGQRGDNTLGMFYFNPSYRVDMILHRNILSRVGGTYYFRPSVDYDFMHTPEGQRLGGGLAAIWTRASNFVQTPGHAADLGVELNGKIYFQSKDGSLNDNPAQMGGFYTQLEYGVLFPLNGLKYPSRVDSDIRTYLPAQSNGVSAAQILRWYVGVLF